jgi:hypothetical protein
VAHYATKAARSGRRSYYSGRSDVHSPGCQIDGKARHESLDEEIDFDFGSGESGVRHEIIAPREYQGQESDPAEEAARNLDWESFLRQPPPPLRSLQRRPQAPHAKSKFRAIRHSFVLGYLGISSLPHSTHGLLINKINTLTINKLGLIQGRTGHRPRQIHSPVHVFSENRDSQLPIFFVKVIGFTRKSV